MATIVPKTVIESGCIKNTSSDMNLELNSSSPSDELLLEAVSQIETMENTDLTRVVQNISREDTPSPVMDLTESFSLRPDNNTLHFSTNHITTKRNCETVSVSDSLSDQFSNSYKISTNWSQPNKINTEVTREDTPSPVMDLGLFSDSENRLSISETNPSQCLVNKCTKKYDDLEETQMLEPDTIFFENSTHNTSTKSDRNTKIIPISSTSLINQSNTNEINPLDECTQLPVWVNEDVVNPLIKKVDSSILINVNVGSLKNLKEYDSSSMKTLHVQSNDDQFINRSSQKIIPSKSSSTDVLQEFGANSPLILCKSETKDCEFNDLETQIIDFDGDSSYKSSTLKLTTNTCDSKSKKLDETIFEADDDDILFCVAQEVETGEQSNENLIDISNSEHFSDLQNLNHSANNIVKSKDSFCNKNKSYNNGTFYGPSQSASTSKPFHIKTKSDFYKPSSFKKNVNTFEADDDDIFSSFIEQESKSQVCDKNTLNNEDFFNCSTQTELILNKVNSIEKTQPVLECSKSSMVNSHTSTMHNDATQFTKMDNENFFDCPTQIVLFSKKVNSKISSTIHDKEIQLLSPSKKFSTSKVCVTGLPEDETQIPDKDFFKIPTHGNKTDTTTSSIHEDLFQVSEMDDNDFFNCPTQKVSIFKNTNLKDNGSFTRYEVETEQIPQNSKTGTNGVTPALKVEDRDFFNSHIQKVSFTIHEVETQNLSLFKETSTNKLETTSVHEKPPQNPEMENEDFFNCPTQKISIPKTLNSKSTVSSTIHEEETQHLSLPNETTANKLETISIHEKPTQNPEIDNEDFFNCPTQKVSISKKINMKGSISNFIRNEEGTEHFPQHNETNINKFKTCAAIIQNKPPLSPEIDDEDFFNCLTQKVSVPKKSDSKAIVSSIHEEETQDLPQLIETNINKFKTLSAVNKHKIPLNAAIDSEDFFNCPTQKVSVSKKINTKVNISSFTSNEEETQKLPQHCETNTSTCSTYEDLNQISKLTDKDFINCPIQIVSVSKKINLKPEVSSIIHKGETQNNPEFLNSSKINKNTNNACSSNSDLTQVSEVNDEDFFNCPSQKISIFKNSNLEKKVSSTLHEEETQKLSKLPESNKISTLGTHSDFTQIPKMNNDDFFSNSPTQKVSISKKIREETQLSIQSKTNAYISETCSSSILENLTQILETNNGDFFDCPPQKVPTLRKSISSKRVSSDDKKELQKYSVTPQRKEDPTVSGTSVASSHKHLTLAPEMDSDDFFNCPTQKVSTSIKLKMSVDIDKQEISTGDVNEAETQELSEQSNSSKYKSVKQKQTVEPNDNNDIGKVRKSTRLDSAVINKLNVQSAAIFDEDENSSKSPKVNKKLTIRVRKDLHSPRFENKSPKKVSRLIRNISSTSTNKNFDLPGCSKTDRPSSVKKVSANQEPLDDVSAECLLKRHSKRLDETIFSPLNVPNVSTNSISEHLSPEVVPMDVVSSTSSDVLEWEWFWNKKKMSSQSKGNVENANPKVLGKKERIQTRAITRKENATDLSRKRKQDSVEENNKRMCKNNRRQILDVTVSNFLK